MATLITGANGFIGDHLCKLLKEAGEEIIKFEGDLLDSKCIAKYLHSKIDLVIHLAAKINSKNNDFLRKINVDGVQNILNFARETKAKKIIFLSTIRVNSNFPDPYIQSKRIAEKIIRESEIPYVIIRPSMVYGPGDKKNIASIIKLAFRYKFIPVFKISFQPLYVDDLVKIIAASMKKESCLVLDVVGQEVVSFFEIIKEIKKIKKFYILNFPWLFDFLLLVFSYTPFFSGTSWQIRTLFGNQIFQGDDWPAIYNIKPMAFKEGLFKMINL